MTQFARAGEVRRSRDGRKKSPKGVESLGKHVAQRSPHAALIMHGKFLKFHNLSLHDEKCSISKFMAATWIILNSLQNLCCSGDMKEKRDIKGKKMWNIIKKIQFLKNIWRLWSLQKAFETFLTEDFGWRKKRAKKEFHFWHTCKCSPPFHSINPSLSQQSASETGWREINKCLTVLVAFTVSEFSTFKSHQRRDCKAAWYAIRNWLHST